MSVYTTITPDALNPWLARYNVGELVGLKGIAAGITNTNYFVTTTRGRFVLTVFEVLRLDELPFYLNLMHHLARHGVAVASPVAASTAMTCTRSPTRTERISSPSRTRISLVRWVPS